METVEAIRSRVSSAGFEPGGTIDAEVLRELIALACRAPSSFNLQHWRFVVVTERSALARLRAVALGQPKVEEAAAVVIVLGDLRAHEDLEATLAPTVERGDLPAQLAAKWVDAAATSYDDARRARDEAVRSASLAAMNLMLAATDRDLASAPMIGFDPEGVRASFEIPDRYLPVMLVALGPGRPGSEQRQKVRLGLDRVLFEGTGEDLPA